MFCDTPLATWPAAVAARLSALSANELAKLAGRSAAPKDAASPMGALTLVPMEDLRCEEQAALRVINANDGPLSTYAFHRRCKMPRPKRHEALYDLGRLGFIEVFVDEMDRSFIRAVDGSR